MADASTQIVKIPRVLVVDTIVPALGQNVIGNLTIPQDADFEWWWLALSRTSGLLKVLIFEQGTGSRQLIWPASPQSQSQGFYGVNVDNLAGTVAGNGAFPIAVPYLMPASRVYTHQFTDSSDAQNTVEIAYHGFALLNVSNG